MVSARFSFGLKPTTPRPCAAGGIDDLMSVPKSKRKVAEFEFYATALKIRTQITEWLMRDFGTKNRFRDASLVARKARMTDEDKALFADLFERYGLGDTVCESYPDWWIAERRRTLDRMACELAENIVSAFDLYAVTLAEWDERRAYQDRAIACVYKLLEETQFIVNYLYRTGGVDVARYMPFVELCETEISLLKGWRKAGNTSRKGIIRKEELERQKVRDKL